MAPGKPIRVKWIPGGSTIAAAHSKLNIHSDFTDTDPCGWEFYWNCIGQ